MLNWDSSLAAEPGRWSWPYFCPKMVPKWPHITSDMVKNGSKAVKKVKGNQKAFKKHFFYPIRGYIGHLATIWWPKYDQMWSFWGQSVIILASFWHHFGLVLVSFRPHFEAFLGYFWTFLGQSYPFLTHFEAFSGPFCAFFWTIFGLFL